MPQNTKKFGTCYCGMNVTLLLYQGNIWSGRVGGNLSTEITAVIFSRFTEVAQGFDSSDCSSQLAGGDREPAERLLYNILLLLFGLASKPRKR